MGAAAIVALVFESLFKYLPQIISIVEQIMHAFQKKPALAAG